MKHRSSGTHGKSIVLAVALALAIPACSAAESADVPTGGGGGGASSGASNGPGSSGATGKTPGTGGGTGGAGSSGATPGGTSGTPGSEDPGTPAAGGVPASPAPMNAFLQSKEYATWAKESAPHRSTGPHGGSVLTFLNPTLDASMKAGNSEHPAGSASVKEFYSGGTLSGWAAMVKTQPTSDGGKGWYWYEVFDLNPNASSIEGQGIGICTGCHSAGQDYVRAPYPLQ